MKTKTISAFDRNDFRKWLEENHNKETKVGIILHKRHTGKPAPTHRELIEEAICFGWIDTIIKKLDDDRYLRNFSRRNNNSKWSDNTLGYAKKLIKEGKMTPMGLKFYKLGLKKPTHDEGIPKNSTMPLELKNALSIDKKAKDNFDTFSPSKKKMLYKWILRAKLPETSKKRVNTIIKSTHDGTSIF